MLFRCKMSIWVWCQLPSVGFTPGVLSFVSSHQSMGVWKQLKTPTRQLCWLAGVPWSMGFLLSNMSMRFLILSSFTPHVHGKFAAFRQSWSPACFSGTAFHAAFICQDVSSRSESSPCTASHKALEDEPRGITLDAQRFPQWIGWENLRIHHTTSSLAAGEGSTSHRQWNSETKLWWTRAQHDGRAHRQCPSRGDHDKLTRWLLDVSLRLTACDFSVLNYAEFLWQQPIFEIVGPKFQAARKNRQVNAFSLLQCPSHDSMGGYFSISGPDQWKAYSLRNLPIWNPTHGQPAWFFSSQYPSWLWYLKTG